MPLSVSRISLVKTLSLTTLIAPLWAGTALAWTGEDVAKRLQHLLAEQYITLTYSKVEVNDQVVTLRDSKVQITFGKTNDEPQDDAQQLNLGDITLSGIQDAENGSYIINEASIADSKIVEDSAIVTITGARLEKLKLEEKPKIDILGRMDYLQGLHIAEISVTNSGANLFKLSNLYFTNEPYSKEKPSRYSWGFKALDINAEEAERQTIERKLREAALEEPAEAEAEDTTTAEPADDADVAIDIAGSEAIKKAPSEAGVRADEPATDETEADETTEEPEDLTSDLKTIQALGLQKIHLTLETEGSWSPYSGEYSVDKMVLNGQNIGSFSYSLQMGGYNLKFVKAMQEFYTNIPKANADNSSQMIAAVGLLQNLTIKGLEIRYQNDSFMDKFLDYQANEKSLTRAELIAELKQKLQLATTYFEGEQLVADAVKAVGDFLDDPKSITLKIQPEQPISFAIMSAVGMAEPKKLWPLLNVKVEANQ